MERRAHAFVTAGPFFRPRKSVHVFDPFRRRRLVLLITFLTGISLFIYEILWMRMLALMFGTTTLALAVVIAVFLAGMGSGNLYFGHRADRTRSPARIFAMCNFGIALFALIVFSAMRSSNQTFPVLRSLFHIESGGPSLVIILSIMLMFVPTFLMGALLPFLGRMYVSDRIEIGRGIGWLYASHTMGNIVGILMATYVLIPLYGTLFTHTIAVITNGGVGFLVIVFPVLFRYKTDLGTEPRRRTARRSHTLFLVIAGITGFCALALEILWTRVLRTYVTNSTYSVSAVLIVYLTGLSFGSIVYFKTLHRRAGPWLLAISLLIIGYYALASLFIINRLPEVLFLIKNVLAIPVFRVALPGIALAAILIFIPAACMGLTFPLLCHLYTNNVEHLGRGIGSISFINTYGSVAGSIFATLVLIPIAGITRSIGIVALIICISALLVLALSLRQRKFSRIVMPHLAVFFITLILFSLSMRQTMILPPSISRSAQRSERILYYNETYDGTVIVTEDTRTDIRACYINNNAVCGTTYDALKVVKMLGHLPYFFNPDARQACIIGFGIGITTSSLALHGLDTIECVEICPGVAQATRFFNIYNHAVLKNRHVHFFSQDGRIHLLTTRTGYDIISCDPTHPTLGCNNLYTREYFQLCKERLAQGGVVCQYLPLHKLSLHEFKMAIRTFLSVFPHVTVWLAHAHAIMVGTRHEQHLDFNDMTDILQDIDDAILHDPYDLTISLILNEQAARSFIGDGPLNTDDHPYLEFFSPASTAKDNWDRNLYEMLCWRIDPADIIQGIPEPDKLARYLAAQRYFLSALIYKNRGQLDDMLKAMEMAYSINPASDEIRFFLEHERTQLQEPAQ